MAGGNTALAPTRSMRDGGTNGRESHRLFHDDEGGRSQACAPISLCMVGGNGLEPLTLSV
jgi:hypothetical protein